MKTTTKIKKLAKKYDEIVSDYTDIFYNQMFDDSPTIDDAYWIGGDYTGVCGIGDYYLNFDMIKLSVDYGVSFDDWSTYYWKEVEGTVEYNYEHYLKVEKGYE